MSHRHTSKILAIVQLSFILLFTIMRVPLHSTIVNTIIILTVVVFGLLLTIDINIALHVTLTEDEHIRNAILNNEFSLLSPAYFKLNRLLTAILFMITMPTYWPISILLGLYSLTAWMSYTALRARYSKPEIVRAFE